MAKTGTISTQQKIFNTAVKLFSTQGFARVSMRDIAGEVGVSVAAIYNHFPSKDSILDAMYKYYSEEQTKYQPKIEALLAQCDTAPVVDLLAQLDFYYNSDIEETMDRIMAIASTEARFDQRSADFIQEHILALPGTLTIPILKRLVELGRIEPVDFDGISILLANYSYAAATRNYSIFPLTRDKWQTGFKALSALIKPV